MKMEENNPTNYEDSFNELEEIVRELEAGNISIDELSEKVKRGAKLIKFCNEKLNNTEKDIASVIQELKTEAGVESSLIEDTKKESEGNENPDDLPF